MSKDLVTIRSVDLNATITKRDGGTYQGVQIAFDQQGNERSKAIAHAALKNQPGLAAKIKNLQAGEQVTFHRQKQGNFNNLIDILPADQAEAPRSRSGGGGGFAKKGNGNSFTPQDTARIARSTAVGAAAKVASSGDEVLALAETYAAFIMAPLGLDSSGTKVAGTETTSETTTESTGEADGKLPF